MLPMVAEFLAPAEPEELISLLIQKGPAFGVNAKGLGDAEWAAYWSDYLETLAPFPIGAVREAFAAWNRCELYPDQPGRHAFYPRAPELFALATKARNHAALIHYRLRRAMEYVEKAPRVIPKEEAAKVAADLKALAANLKSGATMPEPIRPSRSPQEVAADLRRAEDTRARHAGVPISRAHTNLPPEEPEETV